MSAESEISSLVKRYIESFNAQDFDTALTCYRLPFTWLFGPRAITAATPEQFFELMKQSWSDLGAKGLSASQLDSTTVRLLSDNAALAGVVVTRRRTDGSAIAKLGATYLVHRGKDGWRLVANATHPLEAIIPPAGSG